MVDTASHLHSGGPAGVTGIHGGASTHVSGSTDAQQKAPVLPCQITISSGDGSVAGADSFAGRDEAGPDEAGPDNAAPDEAGASILHLPSPRAVVRHALPPLLESTIGPGVLFYVVLVTAGFRGALIAALAWAVLAAVRRVVKREKLPVILVLSLAMLAGRTAVAYATGSAFLYFVQPTASTFLMGVLFVLSVAARRPLAERLAHDFCPLDPDMMRRPIVRKFFLRVSLLWGVVLAMQAGFVLWLLLQASLGAFVVERQVVNSVLTAIGVVVSVVWFVRVMRREGFAVRFTRALAPAALTGSSS